METIFASVQQTARQLRRAPTFTIVAIFTLALGIGANTAIFSLIQGVLLHPAGIDNPSAIVSFHTSYTKFNLPSIGVSAPDLADARDLHELVDAAAMSTDNSFNSSLDGRTQHLRAAAVTSDWFRVFGAKPILGRTFLPEEDQKAANHVTVLSYAAWQSLFGGQADAVGKSLLLDGQWYKVIGVMRSDFDWPRGKSLWVPLGLAPTAYASGQRYNEFYDSSLRLKAGVTVNDLNKALDGKRLEEVRREGGGSFARESGWSLFTQPWVQDAAGDLRKALWSLFAAVAAILLIACANISGLMLARMATRAREFSIRQSLGASAGAIAIQLITEVGLLAGVATVIGVAAGPLLGRLLLLAIPANLAAGFEVHTSLGVLFAAAAFGLLAAVLAGIAPIIQVIRTNRAPSLIEGGRSVTAGKSRQVLRNVLVGSQVAIAFLFVAATSLFVTSMKALQTIDPGFRSGGVLTGYVTLSGDAFKKDTQKADFVRNVNALVGERPGVAAAAAVIPLPFGGTVNPSGSFEIKGRPTGPSDPGPHCDKRWSTPGYLQVMQVPLLRGRWFGEADDKASAPPVAVVDEVLAHDYWPNADPVGQHVRLGSSDPWAEVIGVIGHVRRDSLEVDEKKGVLYEPFAQNPVSDVAFVVRTKTTPESMSAVLTEAVHSQNASEAVYDIHTMDDLVMQSLGTRHLLTSLLTLFGALALVLAVLGIYGLLSFTVAQRTPEIGVRMALGAQRWQVISLVSREVLALIGTGCAAGLALFLALHRLLGQAFPALPANSASSLAIATISLLSAAMCAAVLPAHRSASVDPSIILRNE